ncbi:hypothetical protein [Alteromonas gilva]|uniref:Uncharacterized protein n=1 Tax=Alteromonas gilva TaxID=2987522 RepID=A0ABT5KZN7_9ALTE|nr:hypothetical protein [Alteromonas gilva]MDC8830238.1 hypothetical protein [Alteromonas gilva]
MNPKILIWLSNAVFIAVIAALSMQDRLAWPTLLLVFAVKLETAVINYYVFYKKQ